MVTSGSTPAATGEEREVTVELTVRRMIGMRGSSSLLHLVLGEDPFARALCGARPREKRGWSAPLDEARTCAVCAETRWLLENRRTNDYVRGGSSRHADARHD